MLMIVLSQTLSLFVLLVDVGRFYLVCRSAWSMVDVSQCVTTGLSRHTIVCYKQSVKPTSQLRAGVLGTTPENN